LARAAARVAYCDAHVLALDKPSGMLSQPDRTGDATVLDAARAVLGNNAWVGPCNRLDRPASGLTILARNERAAARITKEWRAGRVRKAYLCLAYDLRSERERAACRGPRHVTATHALVAPRGGRGGGPNPNPDPKPGPDVPNPKPHPDPKPCGLTRRARAAPALRCATRCSRGTQPG